MRTDVHRGGPPTRGVLLPGSKAPECHRLVRLGTARHAHALNRMPGGFDGAGNPVAGRLRLGISL
jgi:hypothetical protein